MLPPVYSLDETRARSSQQRVTKRGAKEVLDADMDANHQPAASSSK